MLKSVSEQKAREQHENMAGKDGSILAGSPQLAGESRGRELVNGASNERKRPLDGSKFPRQFAGVCVCVCVYVCMYVYGQYTYAIYIYMYKDDVCVYIYVYIYIYI